LKGEKEEKLELNNHTGTGRPTSPGALIIVPAARQKNVRQKNKRRHFSVLHFSVRLFSAAETMIKASTEGVINRVRAAMPSAKIYL